MSMVFLIFKNESFPEKNFYSYHIYYGKNKNIT